MAAPRTNNRFEEEDLGYQDFSLDGVSLFEEEDLDGFYKKFVQSRISGVKLESKCTIMMYGPTRSVHGNYSWENRHLLKITLMCRKQLRDFFSTQALHDTILQILDMFMSMGKPNHWVNYLTPDDARSHKLRTPSGGDNTMLSDATKFDQLMVETRAVLSSVEFGSVVEISLKAVVNGIMEDIGDQSGGGRGMPLAKLLPRIALMGPSVLEEPSKNRFIQIIRNIPEVELFFTLLYANMPAS